MFAGRVMKRDYYCLLVVWICFVSSTCPWLCTSSPITITAISALSASSVSLSSTTMLAFMTTRIRKSTWLTASYGWYQNGQYEQQQRLHRAPHQRGLLVRSSWFIAVPSAGSQRQQLHDQQQKSATGQVLQYRIDGSTRCSMTLRDQSQQQQQQQQQPSIQVVEDDKNNGEYADDDTIFALASGPSTSGQPTAVGIIRLSGGIHVLQIIEQLLKSSSTTASTNSTTSINTNPNQYYSWNILKPRQATLRKLYNPKGDIIDMALLIYFPAPYSYTGEHVIEIHCHGSYAILQEFIEETLPYYGARLAQPGEFTQRAYIHGKMDLLQIEALSDLLYSDTSQQRIQALSQLDGSLSTLYQTWRSMLITGLAHAEAIIDFGDDEPISLQHEEEEDVNINKSLHEQQQQQQNNIWGSVIDQMKLLQHQMKRQLQDQRRGELVRQGLQVAIVGPPNVGKSSFFNILANQNAAIVSSIPGTTRDVITIPMNLNGMKCILFDTAGLRNQSTDIIEVEGMKRSIETCNQADLVVIMVDLLDPITGIDILHPILYPKDTVVNNNSNTSSNSNNNISNDSVSSLIGSTTLIPQRRRNKDQQQIILVANKLDLYNSSTSSTDNCWKGMINPSIMENEIYGYYEISCHTQQGIETFLMGLTQWAQGRIMMGNGWNQQQSMNEEATLSKVNNQHHQKVVVEEEQQQDPIYITRLRHRQHIQCAVDAIERFLVLSQQGFITMDIATEELRLACSELGRITGAIDVEEILDQLFRDFCIGK